jgi:short-subunit dehydrogenase
MATNNSIKVFLTGASSGIGLEIAKLLATEGYEVWGTSREPGRLPSLPNFHGVVMDLTDTASIRDGFARSLQQAGHFDVLINNAGYGYFGPVECQSAEIVREQFQVMVHGPLELIRLVLPSMRQRQRGRILNVSSLAAQFPIPYMGIYSATKAALASLSKSLRVELAHTPIRVVDVQPGDIRTPFHQATRRVDAVPGPADQTRIAGAWNTIDRNMAIAPSPECVAKAVLRVITSSNPPPVVKVGGLFQTKVAPLAARLAPQRLAEWVLRRYFGI